MGTLRTLVANCLPYGFVNRIRLNAAEVRDQRMRVDFYSRFVSSGDIVFDVGANRGNRVSAFAALGAKVHAFEPQQNCVEILREKFLGNKNVSIHPLAVGAEKCEREMFLSSTDVLSSMSNDFIDKVKKSGRFENVAWNKSVIVQVETLDQLMAMYGTPRFIKIDVEGFELEVLSGLSRPVSALSFEWTPELHETMIRCILLLRKIGFESFNISFGESLRLQSTPVSSSEMIQIVDCLKNAKTIFGDIYAFSE